MAVFIHSREYAMAMSEAIQEMYWKRKYKRHNDWFLNN
ncbi:hypothetical protein M128_2921 [Bacteroides fragilis str. S6L8]|uniref:Uncharacterized protein n=1 Tax=Bacteroides fragilis str. 2-F-2 \|nr:hypothetical protein M078_2865 [Bacteroides fragilis str. 2-F-2 \